MVLATLVVLRSDDVIEGYRVRDGALAWTNASYAPPGPVDDPTDPLWNRVADLSSPVVLPGLIVFLFDDSDGGPGHLEALSARTGALAWSAFCPEARPMFWMESHAVGAETATVSCSLGPGSVGEYSVDVTGALR